MLCGQWKSWANTLKKNTYALYLASREPRVPLIAKIVVIIVVAYALSPIDLIPDFIPILGYIDDMLLLPIGIWLALRLIPREIWLECQQAAEKEIVDLPRSWRAGIIVIVIWFIVLLGIWLWVSSNLQEVKNI